jgi:hypothetical protein
VSSLTSLTTPSTRTRAPSGIVRVFPGVDDPGNPVLAAVVVALVRRGEGNEGMRDLCGVEGGHDIVKVIDSAEDLVPRHTLY